ncbi:MAG TPA: flagellar motor switch protein FliN [Candidatus Sulfotelmatobacter sp.]|nr:flagellar motor switch protein FliN [Candidatus Sulfotelmatobacter sp.]
MSDIGPDLQIAEPHLQLWADMLARVLAEVSGRALSGAVVTQAPAEMPLPVGSDFWIVAACSGALRGELSLRISAQAALQLAQLFMGEPPNTALETTPEHREAVLELLRQTSGFVATGTKGSNGEVQLRLEGSSSAPTWPASVTAWLKVGDEPSILIEMQLSAALVAALRADRTEESSNASSKPPSSLSVQDGKVSLGLLMDVELAVTLRFGTRRMLLREVLEINPGSVIGLDRQVHEPVDILLDGRVVARGEVVVIDGNYGLRVLELPAG